MNAFLRWFVVAAVMTTQLNSARAEATEDPLRAELARVRAAHPAGIDDSVLQSVALQLDISGRIAKDFAPQSAAFRARAQSWLKQAAEGKDPLQAARGQIVQRSYDSAISQTRQGYAIYLPKDYDPSRAYPMMIVLHGGSANGNLFLGVVLGNNMNWKEYDQHLWDDFTPRYFPDWIVVAPDGYGQVMWRFMGEQDVLDVMADVQKHYHVDADRVVLTGLSNGGVGAYTMGMRHAWRFSAVLAIAGAPSWLRYAGGTTDPLQAQALHPLSAMSLAENAINTDFRYFHGHSDPGPMRPAFVEEFGKHIATLGVPYKQQWFDAGHDLLYLVVRRGAVFKELENVVRKQHPKEVRLVTGDYRAARQHWLNVTRIERLPELARLRAVADGGEITIETKNARAFEVAWRDAPLTDSPQLRVKVDGQVAYDGPRASLPQWLAFAREGEVWKQGKPAEAKLEKKPGLSGPITDAEFGGLVHVYGTGDASLTDQLRKTAERGARGWPLWLWRVDQRVVADTEVTPELMRDHDLVLYGTPGSNAVLQRMAASLPIKIESDAVVVGEQRYTGKSVGAKFIYPNPLSPAHYVIVQAAPTMEGVSAGHNLPDFLPDYVVYDLKSTRSRPRLLFPSGMSPLLLGYFDARWQLDPTHTQSSLASSGAQRKASKLSDGNDPESAAYDMPSSPLPVPAIPVAPPPPSTFRTQADTQAGKAAREIAKRVSTFTNYRSKIQGATWVSDARVQWQIREAEECLAELKAHDINVEAWSGGELPTPVATPIRLRAAVSGVSFRFMHAGNGAVLSCELAARLSDIAEVVKKHGVHTVYVLSAYRDHPFPSFHTLGLALDLSRFDTDKGPLVVKTDFVIDHNHQTCSPEADAAPGLSEKHRELHAIACELASLHKFASVLTPNYNVGHRDHFHVDIRPDDARLFLR